MKLYYLVNYNLNEAQPFGDCYLNFNQSTRLITFGFVSFLTLGNFLIIQMSTLKREKLQEI
jgi:hypothetical protein